MAYRRIIGNQYSMAIISGNGENGGVSGGENNGGVRGSQALKMVAAAIIEASMSAAAKNGENRRAAAKE